MGPTGTLSSRKRSSSDSVDSLDRLCISDTTKKPKISKETRQNAYYESPQLPRVDVTTREHTSAGTVPIPPLGSDVRTLFKEIRIDLAERHLIFRNDVTKNVYDTQYIEDLPSCSPLRESLSALHPLPEIALLVRVFSTADCSIPNIALKLASTEKLQCDASLSSAQRAAMPCCVELILSSKKDECIEYHTKVTTKEPSLFDSALFLEYSFLGDNKQHGTIVVVCDFQTTTGPDMIGLYKLARRRQNPRTHSDTSPASLPSSRYPSRSNSFTSRQRISRIRPNLSLSIPPPSCSFIKSALGYSAGASTPAGMSLRTPLDQRIQTPSAPPPLNTDIDPWRLQRYAGTPTNPFTPSFSWHPSRRPTATSLHNLTQCALAATTPDFARDGSGMALASPIATQPIRRSNSYCPTPSARSPTPGGYFRNLV